MMAASPVISLKTVVDCLIRFAPLRLAESWDNVGLLVEPSENIAVKNILLTNDLTQDVMEEALEKSANLIISYHPPIFPHLKHITNRTWKERIISQCLSHKIAVFSPHTSWDAVKGGVNDWLAGAFDVESIRPITSTRGTSNIQKFLISLDSSAGAAVEQIAKECKLDYSYLQSTSLGEAQSAVSSNRYNICCNSNEVMPVISKLRNSSDVSNIAVIPLEDLEAMSPETGAGRICKLLHPISMREAVDRVKQHLGIQNLQIGLARGATLDTKVQTVALCAGAGTSVLKDTKVDLRLTGETSHHAVLDAVHNGCNVILTHHSNSERGFLQVFAKVLHKMLNDNSVSITVSEKDKDPLSYI